MNPYHFIEDLIDYHMLHTNLGDAHRTDDGCCHPPDKHPPPTNEHEGTAADNSAAPGCPTRPRDGWIWVDDPQPGDPDYDHAVDDLVQAEAAMNLDQLGTWVLTTDDLWTETR